MTDLARKALLAALPLLCVILAAPAVAAAAADGTAEAAFQKEAPEAAPVKHLRHRKHHRVSKRVIEDGTEVTAEAGGGRGQDADGRDAARPTRAARAGRAATSAGAGPTVLGDSIGIGLSMASGAPRLAHEGVAIRSAAALAQLSRVPERSTVVLSLGTNDAVGSIRGVEGAVDRIVAIAERNELKVVWLGPPCVFKSWNTTAERLDALLKDRLAGDRLGGRVRYVSAADPAVCDRSLRAGDGVHFTMKGYAMLWKRVVAAEGEWARPARDAAAETRARTASNDR